MREPLFDSLLPKTSAERQPAVAWSTQNQGLRIRVPGNVDGMTCIDMPGVPSLEKPSERDSELNNVRIHLVMVIPKPGLRATVRSRTSADGYFNDNAAGNGRIIDWWVLSSAVFGHGPQDNDSRRRIDIATGGDGADHRRQHEPSIRSIDMSLIRQRSSVTGNESTNCFIRTRIIRWHLLRARPQREQEIRERKNRRADKSQTRVPLLRLHLLFHSRFHGIVNAVYVRTPATRSTDGPHLVLTRERFSILNSIIQTG